VSDFAQALEWVLAKEGGYSNHEADPGGSTNFGVTQSTYDRYRRSRGLALVSVEEIPREDVERIYRDGYWSGPAACTPWPLSLVVFDSRVQHGRAVELIQRAACALGAELATDNVWGPLTRAAVLCAVEEHGAPAVCAAVIRERLYHYGRQDRSTRGLFRDGWIARMCALAAAASLYDGPDEGP